MRLYSACDVDPLLDLYDITRSMIEPDFEVFLRDMCESELLRAIGKTSFIFNIALIKIVIFSRCRSDRNEAKDENSSSGHGSFLFGPGEHDEQVTLLQTFLAV
jgi:hypothetical protein